MFLSQYCWLKIRIGNGFMRYVTFCNSKSGLFTIISSRTVREIIVSCIEASKLHKSSRIDRKKLIECNISKAIDRMQNWSNKNLIEGRNVRTANWSIGDMFERQIDQMENRLIRKFIENQSNERKIDRLNAYQRLKTKER